MIKTRRQFTDCQHSQCHRSVRNHQLYNTHIQLAETQEVKWAQNADFDFLAKNCNLSLDLVKINKLDPPLC